ncbi:hypothetical protein [Candidatus Pelagibacter sp. RS40]|uniref:hypothetical protein n=1 Tax=Candidatus Pelagibacter sp. RS40 TaxID=1977865 RepID=UPI000A16B44C|nr:hypothetical protein [Candidatus Pelagibacter sp. RS40]ARJ48790.1 hypothetical protein B8063_01855 [Candidatus Pelagibacter sp. RS40]
MKKLRDPYPITDVYLLEMNAVDAATVTVGDLCERLSNDFDTGIDSPSVKEVTEHFKNIDASKYNSISYGNGADGGYSVYVGVDSKNRVKKIFAEATVSEYRDHPEDRQSYCSFWWDKEDFNDQFFNKVPENRIKLFDLNSKSGLIAVGDHAGPLRSLLGRNDDGFDIDSNSELKEHIDLNYFKKNGIFQNTTPILIVKFSYGLITKAQPSSFGSSVIHKKLEPHQEPINYTFTEFFSNLLDEGCYPTKYIFEDYLLKINTDEYNEDANMYSNFNYIINKNVKLSGEYISNRLPKAIQILKKQTKILFKENFKKAFEIRKKLFEDFIIGIIKDIEPQELDLPTFGKKKQKKKLSEKKLEISHTEGVAELFDGYNFREDISFSLSRIIFPVNKGQYPVYLHCYKDKEFDDGEGGEFAYVKIVVEGIKGCYLNKSKKGKLIVNKVNKESPYLRNAIKKKLKYAQVDKIDLRDSKSLNEIEKLKDIEHLVLANMNYIKDWSPLSKLKKLKHLHLDTCIIDWNTASSFFKAIYKLPNLEKLSTDIHTWLREPFGEFPKNIYPKKLKDFEVIVPKDLKNEKPTDEYSDHKGYAANDHEQYYMARILQVHNLPNFGKIKSLEKLRYYNYFSVDHKEGNAINILCSEYLDLSSLKNLNNLKDVWIYGYDFKKSNELRNTKFIDAAKKILKYRKVKINGISEKTFKSL